MISPKPYVIKYLVFIFLVMVKPSLVFAADITVNDPGNVEGEFDITGTAFFPKGEGGSVRLLIDGKGVKGTSGQTSKFYQGTTVNWSYSDIYGEKLDAGSMYTGTHSVLARGNEKNGGPLAETTGYFTNDNTPKVSIHTAGLVKGAFDLTGTVIFVERVNGTEGSIRLLIDGKGVKGVNGNVSKTYEGTHITWSYSDIYGKMLDAGSMTTGEHRIMVRANAAYHSELIELTQTFTTDNTPIIHINTPGVVSGKFDLPGTVTFSERVNGHEGSIRLLIDGKGVTGTSGNVSKTYEGTDINWSYFDIYGKMLDADKMAEGQHTLLVRAHAPYHTELVEEITTFTVKWCNKPGEDSVAEAEAKCEKHGGLAFFDAVNCKGVCRDNGPPQCNDN